jgi:hypothetical protein
MFDGLAGEIVGALVGGLVSFYIARLVLDRTRRDSSDLAREQASLSAARHLGLAIRQTSSQVASIRSLPDDEAQRLLVEADNAFEEATIADAPALQQLDLRDAVEGIDGVLRNFRYFAFDSGAIEDGWSRGGHRIVAHVQCCDYVYMVGEGLLAYRQGEQIFIPTKPGWAPRGQEWRWALPPGRNVDGSGSPAPGWIQRSSDEGDYWLPEP